MSATSGDRSVRLSVAGALYLRSYDYQDDDATKVLYRPCLTDGVYEPRNYLPTSYRKFVQRFTNNRKSPNPRDSISGQDFDHDPVMI